MKYFISLIFLVFISTSAFAQRLDVGVNIPNELGKNFDGEAISYNAFKGQPMYLLVWDTANELLVRDILKRTEETPVPIVVMCLGLVKTGSKQKNYDECEYQEGVLKSERITFIKKKRASIAKKVKLPSSDHLFVIDGQGKVVQRLRMRGR